MPTTFDLSAVAFDLGVALIGTLVGAWLAFAFERYKRKQEVEDAEVSAGNLAISTLHRACNELANYRQQIIDPARNLPERWFSMRPALLMETDVSIDFASLAFLFESQDTADLPGELGLEIVRYRSVRQAMEERSRCHIDEVQPRVERLVGSAPHVTSEQLLTAVGPRVRGTMISLTDQIVEQVDENLGSMPAVARKFHAALMQRFPKRKFISFAVPPRNQGAQT